MQRIIVVLLFLLNALLTAFSASAQANPKRVALVIGNAAYVNGTPLRNPRNDAQDVAAALERLGFTVVSGFDLGHVEMGRIIQRFAAVLDGAGVGVFFYAGHGLQINGTNYLVPTDSRLETEYSPDFELIRVDVVQRIMENRQRTNILFIDACRDNPLARNLARAMGTRSIAIGQGLAPTESGIGTLVSFSTQPGNVALDGEGRNSPYAAALARHLAQSDAPISDMLISVRRDVIQATKNRQVPWEHSALTDKFYFSVPPPRAAVVPPPTASPTAPAPDPEVVKAALVKRLHRELKRVGCDPGRADDTWTDEARGALQRFATLTKRALHVDEATQDAVDALTSQKFIICRAATADPVPEPKKPAAKPPSAPSAAKPPAAPPTTVTRESRPPRCRLETWSECVERMGGAGAQNCASGRVEKCQF